MPSQDNRHSVQSHIPIPGPTLSVAGGDGGSNATHALLSPDPETLPIGEVSRPAAGSSWEPRSSKANRQWLPMRKVYSGFSTVFFVSPAACCWCRVSCCLFLEMKTFCLLKYSQSRITQARGVQGEENQDQSMKGCSVNSER